MPAPEPTVEADLEALEQEREFLLRSLADLDSEHEAGDMEDDDYRSLTDDYTARAAAVLRAIEATKSPRKRRASTHSNANASISNANASTNGTGTGATATAPTKSTVTATAPKTRPRPAVAGRRRPAASPEKARPSGTDDAEVVEDDYDGDDDAPNLRRQGQDSALLAAALRSRRRWRTAAVIVAVVGFGALAAWAVSRSSGARQAGATATGNSQITGTTATGGVDQRLVNAANLVNQGKVADALKLYDAVLQDDPNQPVALADGGWLEAQAGLSANRADLVDTGLAKIVQAEKVDSSFPDAHFFRGFLLLRAKNDAPGAVTELRTYLGLVDPTAPQVASVQALLQEALKAAGPNAPPGPNAATTTVAPTVPATTSPPTTTHP